MFIKNQGVQSLAFWFSLQLCESCSYHSFSPYTTRGCSSKLWWSPISPTVHLYLTLICEITIPETGFISTLSNDQGVVEKQDYKLPNGY